MEEYWKDIPGLEGRYQASSLGRIRSLDMWVNSSYNSKQFRKGRIRKLSLSSRGYLSVTINIDNKMRNLQVHRLIAKTFIPNPAGFPMINHKDENPLNNKVENLEWCNAYYNSNFGTRNQRVSSSIRKLRLKRNNAIPVLQIDRLSNQIIAKYNSIDEAVWVCSLSTRSHISECCAGKRKTAHGFIWKRII